jgi:hypothetical protein
MLRSCRGKTTQHDSASQRLGALRPACCGRSAALLRAASALPHVDATAAACAVRCAAACDRQTTSGVEQRPEGGKRRRGAHAAGEEQGHNGGRRSGRGGRGRREREKAARRRAHTAAVPAPVPSARRSTAGASVAACLEIGAEGVALCDSKRRSRRSRCVVPGDCPHATLGASALSYASLTCALLCCRRPAAEAAGQQPAEPKVARARARANLARDLQRAEPCRG